MINKGVVLLIFVSAMALTTRAQILDDATEAFRLSSASNKPVLLIFAGSDWCAPCMRFEREILEQDGFRSFAADHLILLKADFPQRKRLPRELQQQNEGLAERYNPTGMFPYLVLIGSGQQLLSAIPYTNQSSSDFKNEIKRHIDHE